MTDRCEICGRTRKEAEELKEKRSDIQTVLAMDEDLLKCGSCLGNQYMGELSEDEELQDVKDEKRLASNREDFYKRLNSRTVGTI